MSAPAEAASPIADVSYRNYDGPLLAHRFRWWIIAKMGIAIAFRRKGFWVLAVLAAIPYVVPGFQLYLKSRQLDQLLMMLGERPFPSYFYDAFSGAQLWIFLTALLVGAASIAGDNRANALQIYLSKPLTKGDYLFGKWMGIFVVVAAVTLAPALVLYLYCLGSFQDQGFFTKSPYLWLQILAAAALPAALHASVMLGFSSWFKRPVFAGGLFAGLYFGSQALTFILSVIANESGHREWVTTIMHLSIVGIIRGIGQNLFNVVPTFFGLPRRMRAGMEPEMPDLWPMLAIGIGLVLIALVAARARVRAVEVVKG